MSRPDRLHPFSCGCRICRPAYRPAPRLTPDQVRRRRQLCLALIAFAAAAAASVATILFRGS